MKMKKDLEIINEQQVMGKYFRMYGSIENPLFLAKDVSEWIEHSDISRMMSLVDEEEKLKRTLYVSGQNREMWLLTEDGLYEILMLSRKPIAKEFKREVKRILKTIRKTGGMVANTEMFVESYFGNLDENTKQFITITLDDKKKLLEENKRQKKEISHQQDVIIGLVEDVDLATKRQRLQQIMRYGFESPQQMSNKWRLLYSEFEKKYHLDLDRRMKSKETLAMKPKIKNKIDYIDKVLDQTPELYSLACKIFENDVESLKEEWFEVVSR